MAQQRDSSLIFSLNQLCADEEERLHAELRSREARIAARQAALEEDRRRRIEADHKKAEALEQQRRAEATRARHEAARNEAIRQAELERVRAETDRETRLRQVALEHQHQERLVAAKRDARLRGQKLISASLALVTTLTLGVSTSVYFGKLKPDAERLIAHYENQVSLVGERTKLLEARNRSLEERSQIQATKIKRLESERSAEPTTPTPPQAAPKKYVPPLPPRPAKEGPDCVWKGNPNDPMNPCLGS